MDCNEINFHISFALFTKENYFSAKEFCNCMKNIFYCLLLFSNVAFAAFELRTPSPRYNIFGGGFSAVTGDVWCFASNPAGLASISSRAVAVAYSPQLLGVKELASSSGCVVLPIQNFGTLSAGVRSFGFELYRELTSTVSFAKTFDEFSLGFNINYYTLTIQRYQSDGAIGIDLGAQISPVEHLSFGFDITNINAPTIAKKEERLPQVFSLGIGYMPAQSVLLTAGLEKDVRFDVAATIGIEYIPIDELVLRCGVQNAPSLFNGGFGIVLGDYSVDYTATSHSVLGITHYLSLAMRWGDD